MQILTIAGNVGKDAVLRRTPNGDAVLGFSVAVENGKDRDGNKRESTWYDCSVWGKRAESLERYITKGCKLTLTGRPTVRVHEGKAYLGVSVNELKLQGGGSDRSDDTPRDTDGSAYGASTGGAPDMDDEIPFFCDRRL